MERTKKAQRDIRVMVRIDELESDIQIVKTRLREAKTFEGTLALRNLLSKLQHERRICGKRG